MSINIWNTIKNVQEACSSPKRLLPDNTIKIRDNNMNHDTDTVAMDFENKIPTIRNKMIPIRMKVSPIIITLYAILSIG